ncbi:MAG: iron-containing redox enzyme family protein [Aquihabitans sp.]
MRLPAARGPLTAQLFDHWLHDQPLSAGVEISNPLVDDDLHLALWCCYELHYRGFHGLGDELEWDLGTLAFRASLERSFEAALRIEHAADPMPTDPRTALLALADRAGPPLASFVDGHGTLDHLREMSVHRSAYQLKEADPHTWGIPRLHGPARSAMIEIQVDEYGQGVPGRAHAEIFAAAMDELGLDASFGSYVDRLPGTTLATDNLVSLFGLHRRLRGALVGHLALFEMCSVVPMSKYRKAAVRLGPLPALQEFYDVHVEADEHHGRIALDDMVAGLLATEPDLAADVIFGAAALGRVEARFAGAVLDAWEAGRSSLRGGGLPSDGLAVDPAAMALSA